MAVVPGKVAPSADDPEKDGISLAGRHHPPPCTPLVKPGGLLTSRPARYKLGFPADSTMWIVFESPSLISPKRTRWVFETMPSPGTIPSPAATSRGSTE